MESNGKQVPLVRAEIEKAIETLTILICSSPEKPMDLTLQTMCLLAAYVWRHYERLEEYKDALRASPGSSMPPVVVIEPLLMLGSGI